MKHENSKICRCKICKMMLTKKCKRVIKKISKKKIRQENKKLILNEINNKECFIKIPSISYLHWNI